MTTDAALTELRRRLPPRVEEILVRSAKLGFLGRMPVADQIDHALGFVFATESARSGAPGSVLDLGSGGGLPGLVLLATWPSCQVVLLDSNERRTEFLQRETEHWRRPGTIDVIRGRAEEVGREDQWREHFDVVTARSFGAPAVTAECAAPLLVVGGALVVSEPPEASSSDRWPPRGLGTLGLTPTPPVRFGGRFGYQVLIKHEPTDARFPRRTGIPTKRPLF